MNKVNYDLLMQKEIEKIKGEKPKLLLHSCCAPCSTACLERIAEFFELSVYYYNPNMDTDKEFILRAEEQKKLCDILGVSCIISNYNKNEFLSEIKGYENAVEGGERCKKCFYLRLRKTADFAKENGYEYFATTLTVSPLKNANMLNEIGKKIEQETGVKYLPTDFKKRGGYLRSIELSSLYNLYRQNYCGCEFSKKRETKE